MTDLEQDQAQALATQRLKLTVIEAFLDVEDTLRARAKQMTQGDQVNVNYIYATGGLARPWWDRKNGSWIRLEYWGTKWHTAWMETLEKQIERDKEGPN